MTATTGGWVQVYRCWCSDSAMDLADLPDQCPGHGARVTSNAENKFEGGVPERHECGWTTCPDRHPVVRGDLA